MDELYISAGGIGGRLGANIWFELTLGVILPLHYGLGGGLVQKFKALYLAYFLQCTLTDYASAPLI